MIMLLFTYNKIYLLVDDLISWLILHLTSVGCWHFGNFCFSPSKYYLWNYVSWKRRSLEACWYYQSFVNVKCFLFTEIGFQVSSISILCSLHMLFHGSIPRNQGAEAQTTYCGWPWRSLAKDISYVICVLYQHSVGECELTLHSSFLYANNKVIYSCNHRSDSKIIIYFPIYSASCCHVVIASYLDVLE